MLSGRFSIWQSEEKSSTIANALVLDLKRIPGLRFGAVCGGEAAIDQPEGISAVHGGVMPIYPIHDVLFRDVVQVAEVDQVGHPGEFTG